MGSTLLRNIVLALALIIFSFVVGIVAADSAQEAAVWLFAVIGILVFIAAGKKIWMGIFLVTPFCAFVPSVAGFSSAQLLIVAIFFYWLILAMLGYVKLEWKKLISLDILVFLFVAYMAFSFYRKPVSVAILRDFGIETDNVGGKEYFQTIVAFLAYLGISAIPFPKESLLKVLKWNLVLVITITLFLSLKGAIIGGGALGSTESDSIADEFQNSRFSYFTTLGITLTVLVYGAIPFGRLIISLKYIVLLLAGFFAVLISGWRTIFVIYGASVLGCAIIKRELLILLFCAIVTYGGMWYLGECGYLKDMPHGIQRVLSMCPGIEVRGDIKRGTTSSSDWRIKMWKSALDPRTGLIQNYIWGDGPVRSASFIERHYRALHRGETWSGTLDFFSKTKQWHSGIITNLSVLGIVGSIVMLCGQLVGACYSLKVCHALRDSQYYVYSLVHLVVLFSSLFFYYISTGSPGEYLVGFVWFGYLKMYYNIALEEGRLQPWKWRKRYVPIMAKAQARIQVD